MKCKFCPFSSDNHGELVKHFVKKHRNEEEFVVKCSVCFKEYCSVASLRSHFSRKHKEPVSVPHPEAPFVSEPCASYEPYLDSEHSEENQHDPKTGAHSPPCEPKETDLDYPEEDTDISVAPMMSIDEASSDESEIELEEDTDASSSECDELDFATIGEDVIDCSPSEWEEAKFLLYLREEGMISQTAIEKAIHGIDNLFHSYSSNIKEKIQEHFEGFSEEDFQKIFDQRVLFESINSKKKLDSFAKQFCQVQPRVKTVLFTEEIVTKTGSMKTVEHCAYICPLLPALERLLNQPDVLECVDEPIPVSIDDIIRSFRDGRYCRSHKILSLDGTLAIIFVFDELEISSPLGPKKHKLALYYWGLVNLYDHLKSSLRSMNLYAIAWAKDLKLKKPIKESLSLDKKYEAHSKIMASFLSDIRKLENGVEMVINGSSRTFKGALYCVSGDSPATNVMAGTKESVGKAHKPCHTCVATHEEMKIIFNEDSFQRRTLESLAADRLTIDQSLLVKDRILNSTLCGLNGPSVISGLEYFDHSKCFVFDIMHVLHEGVLEAHMRCFLHYVVSKKYFEIEEINARVQLVAHQFLDKDRPASIKQEHLVTGLRQTAAQMLSLALCLPFALMEKAAELGERYENFLRLVKISMGLLSHELDATMRTKLKKEIKRHNEIFTQHYPSFEITPKWHYLIHMVTQIINFGPARVTWTMRFEAMHSYFKNLMRIMKNFKNPPKSCSYRYQCLRASQMLTRPGEKPGPFLQTADEVTVSKKVLLKAYEYCGLLLNLFGNPNLSLNQCSKLKRNGVEYRIESAVIADKEGKTFALIKDIVVYGEIKVFILTDVKTELVKYCNAYKILECDEKGARALFVENLPFFKPMPVIKQQGSLYIIPKYHKLGAQF